LKLAQFCKKAVTAIMKITVTKTELFSSGRKYAQLGLFDKGSFPIFLSKTSPCTFFQGTVILRMRCSKLSTFLATMRNMVDILKHNSVKFAIFQMTFVGFVLHYNQYFVQ